MQLSFKNYSLSCLFEPPSHPSSIYKQWQTGKWLLFYDIPPLKYYYTVESASGSMFLSPPKNIQFQEIPLLWPYKSHPAAEPP